ncbi:MAG: hypothetical protein QNM02_20200 [Acidimicrobiia bacterium]|nr:hypothetical protein [Acidimicrobiia bacterium]
MAKKTTAPALSLAEAARQARSGDIWIFTGHKLADRAIRAATNSPVNHVAMVLALDGLPPLLWHAELGRSVTDVWTATRQRGAQLHRLEDSATMWVHRYGQVPYFRQLEPTATTAMEDAALEVVDEMDGRRFPSTPGLAAHWLKGRIRRKSSLEAVYCAEVVAVTYERMGLLAGNRPVNWYDPGRFWSGDRLELLDGARLGLEIPVDVPPSPD